MVDNYPNLNLIISASTDGYYLNAQSIHGNIGCKLKPQNREAIHDIIDDVNSELNKIVGNEKYSQKLDIDSDLCDRDLKRIAELNLFKRIFPESNECSTRIKKLLEEPSKIQIHAGNDFFIPWSLVYDKDLKFGENVDKTSFWGFKHIIEQVPYTENTWWDYGVNIDTTDLQLSFNRNENIDAKFKVNCIHEQKTFFDNIRSTCFKMMSRSKKEEVLSDFSKDELLDSIIYFYCHAQNGRSRSDTYLELTPPDSLLSLADLENYADGHNLKNEPLVFINACESAQISPLFYNGFVRYFMNKGSRAVIGTICQVPAIFSSAFGLGFFKKLLNGENVGDTMVQLRTEFLKNNNNLIGLYYVAYCKSELHLTSPIILPKYENTIRNERSTFD